MYSIKSLLGSSLSNSKEFGGGQKTPPFFRKSARGHKGCALLQGGTCSHQPRRKSHNGHVTNHSIYAYKPLRAILRGFSNAHHQVHHNTKTGHQIGLNLSEIVIYTIQTILYNVTTSKGKTTQKGEQNEARGTDHHPQAVEEGH